MQFLYSKYTKESKFLFINEKLCVHYILSYTYHSSSAKMSEKVKISTLWPQKRSASTYLQVKTVTHNYWHSYKCLKKNGKDSHIAHRIKMTLLWPLVNITKIHPANRHSMLDVERETIKHNYVVRYITAYLYCDKSQYRYTGVPEGRDKTSVECSLC
jgi:hypothetical protein